MTKEFFKSKKEKSILKKIKEWSNSSSNLEICGLIGESDGEFTALLCENQSISPRSSFAIDPMEYLLFLEQFDPVAVFHSHVAGDETESEKDVVMSENSCMPFFIYSLNTDRINIYKPKKSVAKEDVIIKFEKQND